MAITPLSSPFDIYDDERKRRQFDLSDTIYQAVSGAVRGFTTLPFDPLSKEGPKNQYEQVAYQLGNLVGFMGFVPGAGSIGRLAASNAMRGGLLAARSLRGAGKAKAGNRLYRGAQTFADKAQSFRSIPLLAADKVIEGAASAGKLVAGESAMRFMGKSLAGDIARGGVHAGTAGAVSAWTDGLDAMMENFMYVGQFGAVGKAIANVPMKQMFDLSNGGRIIARAAATGIYEGGFSAAMGNPGYQVLYDTLLGSYFGGKEFDRHELAARETFAQYDTQGTRYKLLDPENKIPEFKELSPEAQAEFDYMRRVQVGSIFRDGRSFAEGALMRAVRDANDAEIDRMLEAGTITEAQVDRTKLAVDLESEIDGLRDEGYNVEEAHDIVAKNLSDRIEVQQSDRSVYNLREGWTVKAARTPSDPARSVETDHSQQTQALEDHRTPEDLRTPSGRVARYLVDEGGLDPAEYPNVSRRVAELIETHRGEGDSGYEAFISDMQSEYDVTFEESPEAARDLRKTWKKHVQGQRKHQLVFDAETGSVERLGDMDAEGKRVAEFPAETVDEATFREAGVSVFSLSRTRIPNPEKQGAHRDIGIFEEVTRGEQTLKADHAHVLDQLDRNGFSVLTGVKDKGELEVATHLPDRDLTGTLPDYVETLDARVRELNEGREEGDQLPLPGEVLSEQYGLFEAWMRESDYGQGMPSERIREIYGRMWHNNMRLIEIRDGGISAAERAAEGRAFVGDVVNQNKRAQGYMDGSLKADPTRYPERTQEQGGLKVALVHDTPTDPEGGIGQTVEGLENLRMRVQEEDGTVSENMTEQQLDGGFFLRQDVFDALLEDAGNDPEGGSAKGSVVYTEEGKGLVYGKFAYFRAGDGQDADMATHGLDGMMMRSAAKQRGKRPMYDFQLGEDGFRFYEEGTTRAVTPEPITVPFEGLRMNPSVTEKPGKDLSNKEAVKQLGANLSEIQTTTKDGKSVIDVWHEEYTIPSIRGKKAVNEQALKYLSSRNESDLEGLNVDDLGLEVISRVLTPSDGKADDNALYRKVMDHILSKRLDPEMIDEDEGAREQVEYMREVGELNSAADMILELWDRTPATVNHPFVSKYADAVIRKYMLNRATKPVMEHSFKSIGYPYDPHLQRRANSAESDLTPLEKGVFYMGDAHRERQVRATRSADGEVLTMGELWERYKGAKGAEKDAIEKDLEHVIIRVPSDSISGSRPLRFGGFTGRRGAGIHLHPYDMEYLGGMDYDIDSVFGYQDLDPRIVDALRENDHEWTDPETGAIRLVKENSRETFVKESPGEHDDHFAGMGDPRLIWETAKSAYDGARQIGTVANAGRRGNALIDIHGAGSTIRQSFDRNRWPALRGDMEFPEGAQVLDVYWETEVAPDGGERFRTLRRDAMGFALDAANERGIMGRKEMQEVLSRALLGTARTYANVRLKSGKEVRVRLQTEHEPSMFEVDAVRGMVEADGLVRRKGEDGEAISLHESISELKEWADRTNGRPPSTWYAGLKELARSVEVHDPEKNPAWFLGPRVDEMREEFDRMIGTRRGQQVTKEGRELLDLTGRKVLAVATNDPSKVKVIRGKEATGQDRSDLYVQDVWDMVTTKHVAEKGRAALKAGHDKVELAEARKKVDALKEQWNELQGNKAAIDPRRRGASEQKKRLGRSYEEYEERAVRWVTGLPEPLRQYAEAYHLGSLHRQESDLSDHLARTERYAEHKGIEGQELTELMKESKNYWWSTGMSRMPFTTKAMRPEAIREVGKIYNEFAQAAHDPDRDLSEVLSPREMTDNAHFAELVEGAHTMNDAPLADEAARSFVRGEQEDSKGTDAPESSSENRDYARKAVREAADLPEIDTSTEEGRELKAIQDEITSILKHDPRLIPHIQAFFEGQTASVRSTEVGTSPEAATLQDLRDFANSLKDVRGRSFLDRFTEKGLELKRRHWFNFPDWIADLHKPFDREIYKHATIVARGDRPAQYKEVQAYTSRFGKMTDVWGSANEFNDREANLAEARHNERWKDVLDLGQAGETIQDYVVARREMRLVGGEEGELARRADELVTEGAARADMPADVRRWLFYKQRLTRARKAFGEIEHKRFSLPGEKGKSRMRTGLQIAREMDERTTELAREVYEQRIAAEGDLIVRDDGGVIDVDATREKLANRVIQDHELPEVGLDALQELAMEMAIRKLKIETEDGREVRLSEIEDPAERNARREAIIEEIPELRARETEQLAFDAWWPHGGYSKKRLEEAKRREEERVAAEGGRARDVREVEIRYKHRAGMDALEDGGISEGAFRVLQFEDPRVEDLENASLYYRPGHTRNRGEDPLPGYDRSVDALVRYEKQLIRAKHNLIGTVVSHGLIDDFRGDRAMGPHTEDWAKFMKVYNRNNLGYPSVFPAEWLQNKDLKIKNGPYYWFTDQAVYDVSQKISEKFFGGEPLAKDPEDMGRKLQTLSTLEGKWQMMTLLSRTKTFVNNIVGGSANTAMSAGMRPWYKANRLSDLQRINPDWTNWDAVVKDVERLGGVENFIANELKLNGVGSEKAGQIGAELRDAMKDEPELTDRTVSEVLEKHGVARAALDAGAFFMRSSERHLRSRAFLAHLVKAREVMEVNGLNFEYDHPWLVQMAQKGVRATQFMYSNAERPQFAATALGRMFSRFQLFSWNSVRFRRDVYKEAKRMNYKMSFPEGKRLRRMMTADAFVFALAGLFPATMFESALASPWDELKEMTSFLFGDEEHRQAAFYGRYPAPFNPIQAVTPPVANTLHNAGNVIGALVSGEWDRFTSYQAWTLFPFGLQSRDILQTIENPARAVDHLSGIPASRLGLQEETEDVEDGN